MLSFTRFLSAYSTDVKQLPRVSQLVNLLVNLTALALSTGESFLPDSQAYDDLFYKLVEAGDILIKFRDVYESKLNNAKSGSIDTLISVSRHYHSILEERKTKRKNLSPKEVHKVIQQGYETLSIQAKDGIDQWDKFREADHKAIVKKVARMAIEDAKEMISKR